jgi:hypothetical protein
VDVGAGFRLLPGSPAPCQQSPVTCGSACLVVARLLLEPALAAWLVSPADSPLRRFADLERGTMRRTNGLAGGPGALQLPWPRSLGTPPWGAMAEIERTGSLPGTRYELVPLRHRSAAGLTRAAAGLVARVSPGRPALLYVGSATLPRHVVLVFVNTDGRQLLVYEPARGEVVPFAAYGLGGAPVAGWPVPWLVIQPQAQVSAVAPLVATAVRRRSPAMGTAGVCQSTRSTSRTSRASAST